MRTRARMHTLTHAHPSTPASRPQNAHTTMRWAARRAGPAPTCAQAQGAVQWWGNWGAGVCELSTVLTTAKNNGSSSPTGGPWDPGPSLPCTHPMLARSWPLQREKVAAASRSRGPTHSPLLLLLLLLLLPVLLLLAPPPPHLPVLLLSPPCPPPNRGNSCGCSSGSSAASVLRSSGMSRARGVCCCCSCCCCSDGDTRGSEAWLLLGLLLLLGLGLGLFV